MKYGIINLEKLSASPQTYDINTPEGKVAARFFGAILHEEEAMGKFKEVWNSGKRAGMDCTPLEKDYTKSDYDDMEEYWEQLSKNL